MSMDSTIINEEKMKTFFPFLKLHLLLVFVDRNLVPGNVGHFGLLRLL